MTQAHVHSIHIDVRIGLLFYEFVSRYSKLLWLLTVTSRFTTAIQFQHTMAIRFHSGIESVYCSLRNGSVMELAHNIYCEGRSIAPLARKNNQNDTSPYLHDPSTTSAVRSSYHVTLAWVILKYKLCPQFQSFNNLSLKRQILSDRPFRFSCQRVSFL